MEGRKEGKEGRKEGRKGRSVSGVSSYKDNNHEAPPSNPHLNLVTSQRLQLQIPSHWELGLQHMNLDGHKHCIYNNGDDPLAGISPLKSRLIA